MCMARINLPNMYMARINLPNMCLARINLPNMYMARIKLPNMCLARINLPNKCLGRINLFGSYKPKILPKQKNKKKPRKTANLGLTKKARCIAKKKKNYRQLNNKNDLKNEEMNKAMVEHRCQMRKKSIRSSNTKEYWDILNTKCC